ncbi:MAG TPA: MFS transporter [Bradyrhizobium sp.]|nr:MFS transporter [Bradyrhizobium sp.]
MKNNPVTRRFAPTALMLGNIVTGCSVMAPAAMLAELSGGLGVSITTAGLLITFGAVVLCVGSPVTAWLTSRMERRNLLAGAVAIMALTNVASAFAPDYASLLAIRLLMLAVGALYTPQAVGTGALIVPERKRGSTLAYIFLGWSVAAAVGMPLITFIASRYGWRAVYGGIGAIGLVSFLLLVWRLPSGLRGSPVELRTWVDVGRNRTIVLLLLITTLQTSGQFVVFTFMAPLLVQLTGAGPDAIALVFLTSGVFGIVGIVVASRIVDSWGAYQTSALSTVFLLVGVTGWTLSAGIYPLMVVSVAIWGLGFASSNSMQQVRLVSTAPSLASASVSLNTSVLYVGQAIGSAVGGALYAHGQLHGPGYVAVVSIVMALATVLLTRPRPAGALTK